MSDLAMWWEEAGTAVTVEKYTGEGLHGPTYAAPTDVTMWASANPGLRVSRGTDGAEVVSTLSLYGPTSLAPTFTPGSRVTVAGRPHTVAQVDVYRAGGLDLPEHVAVRLE